MSDTILKIKGLNKTLGKKQILHSIDMECYGGEVYGFLGPNGAGKTTTIKIAVGLLQLDEGEISIDGKDIRKDFEGAMANVGGIVENPEMYKYLSGLENLRQYARMREGVTEERIKEVVELVRLSNRINDKVSKYSLGMRQRLGVAQAILHRPKLLILDEPTNGLDPQGIKELRDILKELAHKEGTCVVVSSHLMSEMEMMCDRVGIIANGKMIGSYTMEELISQSDSSIAEYVLEVDDPQKAMGLIMLADEGKCIDKETGAVVLSIPVEIEKKKIASVNKTLIEGGVSLYTVHRRENKKLEDVFIELTGGKVSTKIMIVLIIICALGLSGIALFAKHNMESNNYSSYDATGDYQQTIDWLKDTNGDPNEIAMWQYLIDNDIDSDDWRYDVLSAIFADGTGDMSGIKKYLDDNDWRGFCQYRLDNDILTEGEKWEYQYRLDKDISFDKSNEKKNDLIMTVANAKNTIATMGDAKSDGQNIRAKLEDNIKLALYQLDNDKLDNTANQMTLFETSEPEQITFWTVFLTSTSLVTVVALLAIVIAGGIVSSEFSQGTVKFLLINPVKRWKILMSKYFTVITVGYIMLCILFVVMIPITGLMLGFDGFSTPYIYVSGGEVKEMPTLLYAAEQYLMKSVEMVVMSTLAFAISSLVRSTALAIGVSVFTMCIGSTVTQLLGQLGQDWARFLVFANTDLASISKGGSIFAQHSLTFAVGVLIAHMVVFLLTAWDGFTKRSV